MNLRACCWQIKGLSERSRCVAGCKDSSRNNAARRRRVGAASAAARRRNPPGTAHPRLCSPLGRACGACMHNARKGIASCAACMQGVAALPPPAAAAHTHSQARYKPAGHKLHRAHESVLESTKD